MLRRHIIERLDRTEEGAGSSPASSTSKRPANARFWLAGGEEALLAAKAQLESLSGPIQRLEPEGT
jgi:hypothetical protein